MTHTILIMAGGTGGHVFPALAVADYLKKAGWRIVWLGTKGGMEESLVSQKGHDIKFIDFSGLRGKNLMVWFTLPVRLLLAFWQSAKLLFQLRPDVVLGMGGYPAFPGGIMASLLNKPLLIHEQNSIPGLTNKILVKFADKVLTGFPDSIKDKKKVVFSGNPVRNEISQLDAPDNRYEGRSGNLKLLIIGGSLGAQALNTIVPQALKLIPDSVRPLVIHQAGGKHLETLNKNYAEAGVEGELVVFIEDMAVQYSECHHDFHGHPSAQGWAFKICLHNCHDRNHGPRGSGNALYRMGKRRLPVLNDPGYHNLFRPVSAGQSKKLYHWCSICRGHSFDADHAADRCPVTVGCGDRSHVPCGQFIVPDGRWRALSQGVFKRDPNRGRAPASSKCPHGSVF